MYTPVSKRIKIGLIGLGDIAQKAYLPILCNHSKIQPILCTRNKSVLQKLAQQYNVEETYRTIDELLKAKPNAVMIHSATNSHYFMVKKFLNAGIPVFVDKPLSYSLNEVEELLNLAHQTKTLIYVGFNRRFAPLVSSLGTQKDPLHIYWQKNRVNLPDEPRIFVFDDFIHVIDSLRFLKKGKIENLNIISKTTNKQLESIQVQWQVDNTSLMGLMNRVSGITEEKIEYFTKGNKWIIDELTSGYHYQEGRQNSIQFDNWANTLYKRGFVDMIEDWINVLEKSTIDHSSIEDIWETHQLCEKIVEKVKKDIL